MIGLKFKNDAYNQCCTLNNCLTSFYHNSQSCFRGTIRVAEYLDREKVGNYGLIVTAKDGGNKVRAAFLFGISYHPIRQI